MDFHDLVEDIILRVLEQCEVHDLARMSQTCKYHHHLVFKERSIWVSVVSDLCRRGFIDELSVENLRDLSTEEFIMLVKKSATGPITWSPPEIQWDTPPTLGQRLRSIIPSSIRGLTGNRYHSRTMSITDTFSPEILKRIVLHPTIPTGPGILTWENEAKLLRGGRYVLFNNWRHLECWRCQDDTLLWKHIGGIPYASDGEFAAEVVKNGKSATIVVCQRTYEPQGPRKNFVTVIQLDLQTGISEELYVAPCPPTSFDNSLHAVRVCGDIATVAIDRLAKDQYIILNWRTKSSFRVRGLGPMILDLMPHHIVFSTATASGGQKICVSGVEALAMYWPGTTDAVSIHDIPTIVSERIPNVSRPIDLQIAALESPLQRSTYRIWLYLFGVGHAVLRSYRMSSRVGTFEWHLRSHIARKLDMDYYRAIAYSGHSQKFNGRECIIPPRWPSTSVILDLADEGDFVDVAAYSGALTYATHHSLVVLYYR
ncbi:hypothetical protein B0H10DRAFT_2038547 [Mycena sp. CBHHK59/15]|nr:hypothetical protein B0H10DRAFT_2038547 [Mycena sp. CBHHK59/15]